MREKIPNEINLFDEIIPLGVPEDADGMDEAEGEEAPSDDKFYTDNYNTDLSPKAEEKFQAWLKGQSKDKGKDMSKDLIDYDLRGFWKAGAHAEEKSGHGPDTYKKPNHPTFSKESKYHVPILRPAGEWGHNEEGNYDYKTCEHTIFIAHDEGFEFRTAEVNKLLKINPKTDGLEIEVPDGILGFDGFTDLIDIEGGVKIATYDDCARPEGIYFGFKPND
jgi:hypothetical protein